MEKILMEKINNKSAKITIVGLGYVGLPLAVEAAKIGYKVFGLDINAERNKLINESNSYIPDVNDKELKYVVESGNLIAGEDYEKLQHSDIIIICVPTGLSKNLHPDLQHVETVTQKIKENLKQGQLICIESTIFPGTTEEIVLPILEETGLKVERDFYLCHSPERVDPGNQKYSTKFINKIVGGVGPKSLYLATEFYKEVIMEVIPVTSVKIAEMSKVYENTFRAINIASVNELAMICDRMNINVWEVLDAAFTKPFGIMPFYPGPGVGGHCIPVDPHYLEWKAREYNYITKFISLAGEINRQMPDFVREKLLRVLNTLGVSPSKSKVLIIGMAYKKDINDCRESPVIPLMNKLLNDKVEVEYFDPYIKKVILDRKIINSVELTQDKVKEADVVVIITDHSFIDYQWLVDNATKILDTRNVTKGLIDKESKIVLL